MTEYFSTDAPLESTYTAAFLATPSDTVDLPTGVCRGIICDGTGQSSFVRVTLANNEDDTYVTIAVDNHDTKHLAVKRVWATGTTATTVHVLY